MLLCRKRGEIYEVLGLVVARQRKKERFSVRVRVFFGTKRKRKKGSHHLDVVDAGETSDEDVDVDQSGSLWK